MNSMIDVKIIKKIERTKLEVIIPELCIINTRKTK